VRALLIVNLAATSTTPRVRDVILHALASDLDLEAVETSDRGHAVDLGRRAALEHLDLVITFGGDGTVNEVINGMLEAPVAGSARPALAVVPGGSTNVFARSLGLPNNPVEATGQILDALRSERTRTIGLGRADERWFTFCAGLGLDADVVAVVDRSRQDGRRSTGRLYVAAAVREFFSADRDAPPLTLERPGAEPVEGLSLAIVQNTSPWTFFGNRRIDPSPDAAFEKGLDLFALRGLGTPSSLRHAQQLLSGRRAPHGKNVVALHDVGEMTLVADGPTAHQVDGEYLGDRTAVTFRSVPDALCVLV
jgi:diacylglycerol kinase family enzyme